MSFNNAVLATKIMWRIKKWAQLDNTSKTTETNIIGSNLFEIQQSQNTRPHSSCASLLPWDKNGHDTYD